MGFGFWTSNSEKTYDFINAKNGANVNTSVNVAAAVEGVKDDAVGAPVLLLDDDRVLEFLRDKDSGLAGRSQGVDHNVIRQNIELLLLLSLYISLSGEANAAKI
jgi:hypothetical protein